MKPAISNFEEKRSRVLEILSKKKSFMTAHEILNEFDKYEILPGEISIILKFLLIDNEILSKINPNKEEIFIIK